MPKVSVIIPTYNRAHLIGRAIKSVLNQTYRDFEIIIVDDGSTDNTEEVVKSFTDKRIRYIRHKENKGAATARNIGIKAARGEYIAFQDSDDEWLPAKLGKQMKVFKHTSPKVGIVYTDMWRIIKEREKEYWHSPKIKPEDEIVYKEALNYQIIDIGIQSAIVKRECFDKSGMFDEKFPRFIDLEFFIRLSKYYYFYHIAEPLVNYFAGKGISSNAGTAITARKLVLEKYFKDIKRDRKLLAKHYFGIGTFLRLNGKIGQSRKYFIKAIIAYPLNIKFSLHTFVSLFGSKVYNRIVKIKRSVIPHRKSLAKHYFNIGTRLRLNGKLGQGRKYFIKTIIAYPFNKFSLQAFVSLFGTRIYNKVVELKRTFIPPGKQERANETTFPNKSKI